MPMSLNEERTGPTAEALDFARVRERTERMCGSRVAYVDFELLEHLLKTTVHF
jgi:hypothetical protein